MDELQVFESKEFGKVRTVVKDGEPMFCLNDVCRVLEIGNPSDVRKRVSEDGVDTIEVIDSMGRKQNATFINESNLYKTIFQSRKPEAERFSDWVTGEVLPSIRKHGAYATPATIENIIANPDFGIKLLSALKEEQEKNKVLSVTVDQMKPKALFADAVSASHTSILIGDLAKLLKQNGIETGQKRLFDTLRNDGFLIKCGSSKNMPTQRAMESNLFEIKEGSYVDSNGCNVTTRTTKVTGTGQVYFINYFLKRERLDA